MFSLRKLIIFSVCIFNLLVFLYCTESYDYNVDDFSNILVVQGELTNEEGPYEINLSRTINVKSDSMIYETDAIVTIKDQNNSIEVLNEIRPGTYATRTKFQTKIGNEYQLFIITNNLEEFVSTPVKLNPGPKIESIYTEYKETYDFESNKMLKGIDIKINSAKWEHNNYFVRWDYSEIWEIEQKWNGQEVIYKDWLDVEPFRMDESEKSCWKYESSKDIILLNAANLESKEIKGKVVSHLNENSYKPFYGYYLSINQYIINENTYKFWEFLKENNIDNGNIFDNVPYNLESNIECNNGESIVYGYFDAVFKSQKDIFLVSPIEEVEFTDFNERCETQVMPIIDFLNSEYSGKTVYALWVDDWKSGLGMSIEDFQMCFTEQPFCVNCLSVSNTDTEPDFWF